MNDRHEFACDAEIDAAVSSTYRASATEKVPEHLDRTVLAEARRETGQKNRGSGFPAWLIPAAFAAVLALSLSFNLEFNRPDIVPAIQDNASAEGNNIPLNPVDSTNDLEAAVESTGKRLRALDDAMSNLAPGNNPDAATLGDTGTSISQTADSTISARSCDGEVTASAETWWSCIEALQRSGQTDVARAELSLFEAAFPESELAR